MRVRGGKEGIEKTSCPDSSVANIIFAYPNDTGRQSKTTVSLPMNFRTVTSSTLFTLVYILAAPLFAAAPHEGGMATPAESLAVLPGFKVELLRSAQTGEGSWVSMAVDPKG